ncbi:MAG: cyclic nucleotide-binding domain-containing protein, partial [Microcystaceae cyanobacterium]
CLGTLMLGTSMLSLCPKLIVGGMLLFLGLDLLMEWVYQTWFKLPKADYGIIVLILLVSATVGFLQGVIVGIIAAVILFAINYSQISVTKHTFSGATYQSHVQRLSSQERLLREKGEQIYVLELQGLIFFGTAHKLLNQIRKRLSELHLEPVRFILLDFRLVSGLDTSAVLSFIKLKQMAQQQQFHVLLTHLSPKDAEQLQQGGCLEAQGTLCQVFPDLDRGLEWCENQILAATQVSGHGFIPLMEQLRTLIGDTDEIAELMDYIEPLQLSKGDFLFRQGDPSNGLYFLESGQVSVILELVDGKTKRLRTYNSGTILGEIGLYAKAPRSASVRADEPSFLYYLSTEAFARIESDKPRLAASFHKFIVNLLAERLKLREGELRNLLK